MSRILFEDEQSWTFEQPDGTPLRVAKTGYPGMIPVGDDSTSAPADPYPVTDEPDPYNFAPEPVGEPDPYGFAPQPVNEEPDPYGFDPEPVNPPPKPGPEFASPEAVGGPVNLGGAHLRAPIGVRPVAMPEPSALPQSQYAEARALEREPAQLQDPYGPAPSPQVGIDDVRIDTAEGRNAARGMIAKERGGMADRFSATVDEAAAAREQAAREYKKRQAEMQARQAAQRELEQKFIQRKREKVRLAVEDWKKSKPNVKRLWSSMSSGNKAAAIIGMVLSGLGNALKGQGGKNESIELLRAEIDRDVNLQMEAIQRKGEAIGEYRSELTSWLEQFEGKEAKRGALEAAMLSGYKEELDRIAQNTSDEQVKLRARELGLQAHGAAIEAEEKAAQWSAEQEFKVYQEQEEIRQKEEDRKLRDKLSRRSEYTTRRGQDISKDQANKRLAWDMTKYDQDRQDEFDKNKPPDPNDPNDPGNATVGLPGKGGKVRIVGQWKDGVSNEAKKDWNARVAGAYAAKAKLAEMRALQKKVGASYGGWFSGKLNSDDARKLKSLHGQFLAAYIKAMSGATVSKEEYERLAANVGSPETWTGRDPLPLWQKLEERLAVELQTHGGTVLNNPYDFSRDFRPPDDGKPALSQSDTKDAVAKALQTDPVEGTDDPYGESRGAMFSGIDDIVNITKKAAGNGDDASVKRNIKTLGDVEDRYKLRLKKLTAERKALAKKGYTAQQMAGVNRRIENIELAQKRAWAARAQIRNAQKTKAWDFAWTVSVPGVGPLQVLEPAMEPITDAVVGK